MKPMSFTNIGLAVLAGVILATNSTATVNLEFVPVGNAGNAADTTGYGAVGYTYRIAKNETTIGQYCAFLNAVASTDTYGLYNTTMASIISIAGIARNGSKGGYSYSVIGTPDRPITYVSWFNAARFCNWMHNGQPTGAQDTLTTETGAYSLLGAMSGTGFDVHDGASFWIPDRNEWYKAAYYDPTKNGGDGGYWLYANGSNTLGGNTIGDAGAVNYKSGSYTRDRNGLPSHLTDAGVFGPDSTSFYGTNDQSGNVWEWNDSTRPYNTWLSGGSWTVDESFLRSTFNNTSRPDYSNGEIGFRIASVPEPSCIILTMLGSGVMLTRRKR